MEAEFDPLDYQTIADTVIAALLAKPLVALPLTESFPGAGVYLIYYQGNFEPYKPISKTSIPIYVGKAIPKGSRRGPDALKQIERPHDTALLSRLRDHWQSIEHATNIELKDFRCRFLVVTPIWITIAEALLIERFRPAWNSAVDGFGLHHPGKTRYAQKRSDWDTLHTGRPWAPNMQQGKTMEQIIAQLSSHFSPT